MPKRLCPFDENFTQLKTKVDMWHVGKEQYANQVFEKTKLLMVQGAIDARKTELKMKIKSVKETQCKGKKNIGPVFKVLKERSGCYFCQSNSQSVSCSYCNKNICLSECSKVCDNCGYKYCPSCCSVSYEYTEERLFCVACCDSGMV